MLIHILLLALSGGVTIQDLSADWKIHDRSGYRSVLPNELVNASVIYFPVDARKFGGHYLLIRSARKAHVFINSQLIAEVQDSASFDLDQLRRGFGDQLYVAVHSPGSLESLKTHIISTAADYAIGNPSMTARPPTFFRDFAIVISMILVFFLVILFRNNPQLTLDYFSFSKVFSATERNETQLASRITSSENLLFYLFSALLMGFLLSAILYSSGPYLVPSGAIQFTSLSSTIWIWIKLSLFILLLLAGKLIIVLLFSTLFDFRETVSFQFFNFLRFVLFTSVALAAIGLLFFIFRVDSPEWYERLIALGLLLLTVGSMVVFLKLLGRLRFSLFHLFSYLCISEFIPLVILFKIFF